MPPVETFAISPVVTVETPQSTATSSASTPPVLKVTAKISGAKYFEALNENDEDPWVQPEADPWQDTSVKQQGVRRGLDQSTETLSEKILRESSESKVDISEMFHGTGPGWRAPLLTRHA